ncbi:MAG: flagellar hook-length control protein FliK [Proteobacteria bacterium]|nr:flagellar hook-length control protein FliK [Desulfobacula sp.]MBU3954677.1 flagellar hook-length control protein FliK [Pseudomonadota bacterium]MBU4130891.1 flagellar hook-length control protein FliK [Pseudomonadota bacterium]
MISKIHISPPEIFVQKETGPSVAAPVFKNNQVVTAKVLGLLAQGKARLLIDGQPVIAKTGMLLKPGEELRLKVVEQKDTVLLKLLEPKQEAKTKQLVSLIRSLSKNNAWPDIARSKIPELTNILKKTALQSGKRDDAFLPRLLENNGLLLEKKMASLLNVQEQGQVRAGLDQLLKQDLKGVLLNQLTLEMTRDGGAQKTITRFLDTLENFQLLNTQTSESGRYLIPFPVFVGSALNFGQLLIDTGEKKQDQNQENQKIIRISFLLDMTQMGPVRADFSILKKAITGRFLLNNDDICDYVKNLIPELKTRLAKSDYSVGNIDCLTAERTQIQPNTLMESLFQNQDDSVVNIVI